MNSKKWAYMPFVLFSMVFCTIACNSDRPESDSGAETAASDTNMVQSGDAAAQDNMLQDTARSSYDRNPNWYVYDYQENVETGSGAVTSTDQLAEKEGSKVSPGKSGTTKPMPRANVKPVVYNVSQTDRPPLFAAECLTDKNPDKCSNEMLEKWVRDHVKFPEADLEEGNDGLERVTFVINQRGKISSIYRVETKKEACTGCAKVAIDAVTQMPDWQPAMLDGKPVSVKVTLPIRFRNI